MYKEYFRFQEEPFNITPDPRFFYRTAQHQEALNHLLYGIRQRKGFICLTGEVGTGKTTLCRTLLRELGENHHTALILNPVLTQGQLLRAILDEFRIEGKCRDRLGYLTLLNNFLLRINSAGHDAILIIDEAQDMSVASLEQVRLLSNLETESQKLLQICLLGQPELRRKLAKPALRQLAQRITVRYHLNTMDQQDTEAYIRHRLEVAGGNNGKSAVRFDPGAVREIYRYSGGTPRLINAIGDKALLAGYVHQTGQIDRRLARIAAAELKETG
ncbi:MAG: AAA family ATPase [Phycisphaerae bacterium]|jgi:general secretion pathway protein A|nr:AAA family ATPase [Phycisphaerae bacterium]